MFSLLSSFYSELIYRPLLNGLAIAYLVLPYRDLGLAIAVLTLAVRLLLHPAIAAAVRSQRAMAGLAPRLREIQKRYGSDRGAQTQQTMALYREAGVHPLSGCLPILIQLPVLIGLYQVFWKGIALADRSLIYSFLPELDGFDPLAFGLVDLTATSIPLALAAGLSQFLQSRFLPPPAATGGAEFERALAWQTRYFFPVLIAGISWSLPSALALYWTVFNLFAIVQQQLIERHLRHEHHPGAHLGDARQDGHPG